MSKLETQFDQHFEVLCSPSFLKGTGLGNEVPFFISTFRPEEQNEASKLIKKLQERLRLNGSTLLKSSHTLPVSAKANA